MVETRLREWCLDSTGAVGLCTGVGTTDVGTPDGSRPADREGSVVAGKSAALLHGFPGFRPGRPVIMVRPTGNARSSLATVIRTKYFDQVERVRRRGLETTGEADTIVTLARDHDAPTLERVVDEVLVRKSCSVEQLAEVVDDRPGSRGIGKLMPIIEERKPDAYQPPNSELERLLYGLANHSRVPPRTRQLPFRLQQVNAIVDLYIALWRLIVEADGRRWHTRQEDLDRDRIRDNEATAHGLGVLRFTWKMLTESPDGCLDTLLRTGRVRSAV